MTTMIWVVCPKCGDEFPEFPGDWNEGDCCATCAWIYGEEGWESS